MTPPVRVLRAGYGPRDTPDLFPDPAALSLGDGLPRVLATIAGRRTAVITGAGVSTASGIPDYRGPDALPRQPMTYQEFTGSEERRAHYWSRNQIGWRNLADAEPNPTHLALARLEAAGAVQGIITQNIDRLHERAGARCVVDLHGRYDRVRCLGCGTLIPRQVWSDLLDRLNPEAAAASPDPEDIDFAPDADAEVAYAGGTYRVPPCPVCGGVLKPDVVFFGESAAPDVVARAWHHTGRAEAVLVLGTSLTVHSARRFVRRAVREDKPVVIVNHGQTRSDADAAVKIDARVDEFLLAAEEDLTEAAASAASRSSARSSAS